MRSFLEFPQCLLPANIHSPPYLQLGIKGVTVPLPPRVPARLVLYFAPKLAKWVVEGPKAPTNPAGVASILKPDYTIINIIEDVGSAALTWIIVAMLQAAGRNIPRNIFPFDPSLITCISIQKSWQILGLPHKGLDALYLYIQHKLTYGTAVQLDEIKAIWESFEPASLVVRLMGDNFLHAFIGHAYKYDDFVEIRKWYMANDSRRELFMDIEEAFPLFKEAQDEVFRRNVGGGRVELVQRRGREDTGVAAEVAGGSTAAVNAANRTISRREGEKILRQQRNLAMGDKENPRRSLSNQFTATLDSALQRLQVTNPSAAPEPT